MKNNEEIGRKILNILYNNNEVISVNIVGSYSENKNLSKVGDIDVVVICKKLNKKIIKKLINQTSRIKIKNLEKKIIINSSFGPVKINGDNILPIHLMVYDVNSHIEHVTSSPFTCYDWERTKWFKGKSLQKIYPVGKLQLSDFFISRRNSREYLKDLEKNKISVRNYVFKNKKVLLKKKLYKIDKRNRGEFVYHIINFLVINLYKFTKNKNIKISKDEFKKLFIKITKNNKNLYNQFLILRSNKEKKIQFYNKNIIILAKNFITFYNKFLDELKKKYPLINFVRHKKTKLNKEGVFLGIRLDPEIIDNYTKKKRDMNYYDYLFISDLKRSKLTSKFFKSKKILQNSLINEIDYGKVDGLNYKILKKKYPLIIKNWKKGKDPRYPDGENTEDVKKRVIKFFKYLKKINNEKKILIITHSFFIRVLLGVILKLDLKKIYKINLKYMQEIQLLKSGKELISNIDRQSTKNFYRQMYD